MSFLFFNFAKCVHALCVPHVSPDLWFVLIQVNITHISYIFYLPLFFL